MYKPIDNNTPLVTQKKTMGQILTDTEDVLRMLRYYCDRSKSQLNVLELLDMGFINGQCDNDIRKAIDAVADAEGAVGRVQKHIEHKRMADGCALRDKAPRCEQCDFDDCPVQLEILRGERVYAAQQSGDGRSQEGGAE